MPRTRSISDEQLLDAALQIVHTDGPASLTFGSLAERVDLAASTLVQRFGSKAGLLQATLVRAWDHLDAETEAADAAAPHGAAGVVELLVRLSGQYEADEYADQLMVLREDLRDPVLRARGESWIAVLTDAIDRRLGDVPGGPDGLGQIIVSQWQGTLTIWGFTRHGALPDAVEHAVRTVLDRLGASSR
jgi:AcrR family transcriptional regulator